MSNEPDDERHPPLTLVIRGDRDPRRLGRPALYRLRAVLRGLLRQAGWVVVDLTELHPSPVMWGDGQGI